VVVREGGTRKGVECKIEEEEKKKKHRRQREKRRENRPKMESRSTEVRSSCIISAGNEKRQMIITATVFRGKKRKRRSLPSFEK